MAGTRRKPGAMGPFVEDYRCWLEQRGYTSGSIRGKLKELGHLGRWLSERRLAVETLDECLVEEFLSDLRWRGHRRVPTLASFVLLLEMLREQQVIAEKAVPAQSALDMLMDRYRSWMVEDRGLAAATVLRYENLARRFLRDFSTDAQVDVVGLTGATVSAFLLDECGRVSVGSAKGRVAELRSLLRFLYIEGLTPVALAASVPPVAGWTHTTVPRSVTAQQVQDLLDSCDRSCAVGIRDFAILMVVSRLGLRSAEAARMELSDIAWRSGELAVRGKARRQDRLPLPVDVGDALAHYLVDSRPNSDDRHVFLTARAPQGRPIRPDLVSDTVRRACRRAGMEPVGAHRLRHGLATTMLANGAALVDISQVLRHQDLATTAIYAKVDVVSLRQVALPWPGARP
jgi:site-specific recombinase XerD